MKWNLVMSTLNNYAKLLAIQYHEIVKTTVIILGHFCYKIIDWQCYYYEYCNHFYLPFLLLTTIAMIVSILSLLLLLQLLLLILKIGHWFQIVSISESVALPTRDPFSIVSLQSDKTLSGVIYSLTRESKPGWLV